MIPIETDTWKVYCTQGQGDMLDAEYFTLTEAVAHVLIEGASVSFRIEHPDGTAYSFSSQEEDFLTRAWRLSQEIGFYIKQLRCGNT